MTRYAVDDARGELIATWGAGHGDVAITVAKLPGGARGRQAMALSAELSGLSEELWHCYTHPASAADSVEVNTEGGAGRRPVTGSPRWPPRSVGRTSHTRTDR